MVLEDASNNTSDSFDDGTYSSSAYPNPPATSSSSGAQFDPSSLPQPLPILGIPIGFAPTFVRARTEQIIRLNEHKLGRMLSPDEAQALANVLYTVEQKLSYYTAAGVAIGGYRCWQTAARLELPFYKPKIEKIDRNKFGPVKGPLAMFARHSFRFVAYTAIAGQVGLSLGRVMTFSEAQSNLANEPRLEDFVAELKHNHDANAKRPAQRAQEMMQQRASEDQESDRSGWRESPQTRHRKQAVKENSGDDVSPTAGNAAWGSESPAADSWETFSNETAKPAPPPQRRPPAADDWNRKPQANRQSPESPFPFDDDASPTGGLFQEEASKPTSPSEPPSRPGESAWDRLRRGGAPVASQQGPSPSRRAEARRREPGEGSSPGDSYTFVEGGEARKRVQEQAQREFDARIERERQGRDFGSDEEKRW